MKSKKYKDLTIDEKINFKSWRFWRLPNTEGFMLTMIDNANSFEREDYAEFTRHGLTQSAYYSMPRANVNQGIYNKLFHDLL